MTTIERTTTTRANDFGMTLNYDGSQPLTTYDFGMTLDYDGSQPLTTYFAIFWTTTATTTTTVRACCLLNPMSTNVYPVGLTSAPPP